MDKADKIILVIVILTIWLTMFLIAEKPDGIHRAENMSQLTSLMRHCVIVEHGIPEVTVIWSRPQGPNQVRHPISWNVTCDK